MFDGWFGDDPADSDTQAATSRGGGMPPMMRITQLARGEDVDARGSVIVRAKNKADTIEATLVALRAQTVPVEIIVVDSGSTDDTLDIARRYADKLIEIPPSEFTYGRALNIGAAAASCDVHFALSAHCVPYFSDWIERSVHHYERADVAGTNQSKRSPDGVMIPDVYYQTMDDARRAPFWGFSNHGSSWRGSVWRRFPFREDLGACEDKEWSWRVLAARLTIAYDPNLSVPMHHRRKAGFVPLWRRLQAEGRAMASLGAVPVPTYQDLARDWWSHFSPGSPHPQWMRRMSPFRLTELHGSFVGARSALALPGPLYPELTELARVLEQPNSTEVAEP
jgi:rhamnosyltransferase